MVSSPLLRAPPQSPTYTPYQHRLWAAEAQAQAQAPAHPPTPTPAEALPLPTSPLTPHFHLQPQSSQLQADGTSGNTPPLIVLNALTAE